MELTAINVSVVVARRDGVDKLTKDDVIDAIEDALGVKFSAAAEVTEASVVAVANITADRKGVYGSVNPRVADRIIAHREHQKDQEREQLLRDVRWRTAPITISQGAFTSLKSEGGRLVPAAQGAAQYDSRNYNLPDIDGAGDRAPAADDCDFGGPDSSIYYR